MLIEFEVGNYLSFKDPVQLSMVAANPFKEFEEENVFKAQQLKLVKSAAIYGANASGKSNLLKAMRFMRSFVLNSAKDTQSTDLIDVAPFKLDTATEKAPSRFQIIFILDELRYRYGFEVDQGVVQSEWLCCSKVNKEHTLFLRNEDGIKVTKDFEEGKGLELRTRSNALFLSTVDQLNGPTAKKILEWFNQLNVLEGSNDEQYEKITTTMLQDESIRPYLMRLIRHADLGIEDFLFDEVESPFTRSARLLEEKLGKEKKTRPITYLQISTKHLKYSDSSPVGHAILNFKKEESEGTKKFFRIAGPILDSLQKGHVVAVDELDAKLHPLLTRVIVRLFHSLDDNPKNAQLIFGTHDTNLLRYGKLRRDQIWFTEKTEQGATDLYSLAEMKLPKGKKVRKDASFEKDYIQGRYGAIPYLGEFSKLFQEEDGNDKTRQDL